MSVFLSDDGRKTFEIINFSIISFAISIFGMVGNVINMIVFWKQGFRITVNIAFFGLAVSDLCCLALMVWFCICTNPAFIDSRVPWNPFQIAFLTASWPHVCFCRITSYITIYITTERYFSIAFPLKVKEIITARITILLIIVIYVVNISALVPEYASSYLGWIFDLQENKTRIGLVLNSNRESVEGVENILHSLLGMTSFVGVVIATTALVTKLRQSSQRRKEMISQAGALVNRDQKMVKMIVLVASILIICYTPSTILGLVAFIIAPDFNMYGKYYNIAIACWTVAYSCQSINSSVNIILYYIMSSNYKRTLNECIFKFSRQFH